MKIGQVVFWQNQTIGGSPIVYRRQVVSFDDEVVCLVDLGSDFRWKKGSKIEFAPREEVFEQDPRKP